MIREELILLYLNNQTTGQDSILVEEWAVENPMDFQLMKEIWEESNSIDEIKLFDTDTEWDHFMDSIGNEDQVETTTEERDSKVISITKDTEIEDKPISMWREWRPVALTASFLFLAIIAYFLFPRNEEIIHLAKADKDEIKLQDNTTVSIEKGSTLRYPKSFKNKEKRIVHLEGIAVFDITPDPDRPFIVETHNSGVKALGTVFEVDASEQGKTGVENLEGLIRFFELGNEENFKDVKEGESFVFDGSSFTETTPLPDPTFRTFEAPKIITPLHSVKEIVNYMYTISNGHTVPKGDDFDWNKKIRIDLNTRNINVLIRRIQLHASLTLVKKDCDDCYEIRQFRVQ